MKKLIYIFLLLSFKLAAQRKYQTEYDNMDSIEFYFVQALDAYRKETYPRIPNIIVSDTLSKASDHHTRYLLNMLSEDEMRGIVGHNEKQETLGLKYHGFDTLIDGAGERANYYDPLSLFRIYGEVVHSRGTYERVFLFISQKEMANKILQSFLKSPGHKEILDKYAYTHVGISIVRSKLEHHLITCVLTGVLSSSNYFNNPNSIFSFNYGNRLEDICE
ncbi:MAG: CAP domain-containing protein [Bacteroidota bacterium]